MSVCSLFAGMYEGWGLGYFISSHRMGAENRVITKTPFKSFEISLNVRMKFRIHSSLSFPRTALKGEWGRPGYDNLQLHSSIGLQSFSSQSQHLLGPVCWSSQCTSQSAVGISSSGESACLVCVKSWVWVPSPSTAIRVLNQAYKPITWELEAEGTQIPRVSSEAYWVGGHPGLHEILPPNKQTQVPTRETNAEWHGRAEPQGQGPPVPEHSLWASGSFLPAAAKSTISTTLAHGFDLWGTEHHLWPFLQGSHPFSKNFPC